MVRTLLLCLLFLTAGTVNAAFTHSAYWKLDSIELTYAGTPCFHPGPNPTFGRACNNSTLAALLAAHIKDTLGPGLSIAYYDLKGGSVLGGASWANWDAVVLPVGLCMSGAVDAFNNIYSTTCRFAIADDDQEQISAHVTECTFSRPQLHVTDGCYAPPSQDARFKLSDTASAVLTILGLLIVLPGMVYGSYRWYCARQVLQAVPLVPVGSGSADGIANHELHHQERSSGG